MLAPFDCLSCRTSAGGGLQTVEHLDINAVLRLWRGIQKQCRTDQDNCPDEQWVCALPAKQWVFGSAAAEDAAAAGAQNAGQRSRLCNLQQSAWSGIPLELRRQGCGVSVWRRMWRAAAKGRDVLAVAQPGSGKTLAYLLAMAARLMGAPSTGASAADLAPAPRGLVLLPTRCAAPCLQP